MLAGCVEQRDSTLTVQKFYREYMILYTSNQGITLTDYNQPIFKEFISKETTRQLSLIDGLYEQEILSADYFLNVQDYDAAWIKDLKVGNAESFLGGEKIEVLIGGPPGTQPEHLIVYTRKEEGRWKIYRVRDAAHQYEQPIYDAGAITGAKTWSKTIEPEYKKLNQ